MALWEMALWQMVKNVLKSNHQTRGRIVLLMGQCYDLPVQDDRKINEIKRNQRKLAEATDMIHVARLLHHGIVNFKDDKHEKHNQDDYDWYDLTNGNRISVLLGDYLLASASRELAQIRIPSVVDVMSSTISHFAEVEFFKNEKHDQINEVDYVNQLCFLNGGSLVAHSCQLALQLASFAHDLQSNAFEIGKHLGIAFEIQELIESNDELVFNNKQVKPSLLNSLFEFNINQVVNLITNLPQSEFSRALSNIVINIRKS